MKDVVPDHQNSSSFAPEHIWWAFGGVNFASPISSQSDRFEFSISLGPASKTLPFEDHILRSLEHSLAKRNQKKIALCFSGGVKSSILAYALMEIGVDFEMFFFNNWFLNHSILVETVGPFAAHYRKKLHVVNLERNAFYRYYIALGSRLGMDSPNHAAICFMIENYTDNYFFLAGDGSLERRGPLFDHIAASDRQASSVKMNFPLIISQNNVFFYLWKKIESRSAELSFFQCTPDLTQSQLQFAKRDWSFPQLTFSDDHWALFPSYLPLRRADNWSSRTATVENQAFRKCFLEHQISIGQSNFWNGKTGCVIDTS